MKNRLLKSVLLHALIYTCTANAELYRGMDSEGNVIYSDTPFENAQEYSPPPISVMDRPKTKADEKAAEDEIPAEFKYMSFDIVTPSDNQTIRNEPDISVSLQVKPGINTAEEHSIWMLVDGNPVVKNTQDMTLQLGRLNRGAHKLQAQIRDKAGKVVVRTRTTVIFVHQTSAP